LIPAFVPLKSIGQNLIGGLYGRRDQHHYYPYYH
jgi:hypothetical protein